jgi:hypothetical protein
VSVGADAMAGSSGALDDARGATDAADEAPPDALDIDTGGPADPAGLTPFRRLTRLEYDHTLRDLIGAGADLDLDVTLSAALAPDAPSGASGFDKGGAVTAADALELHQAARVAATRVLARLDAHLPCAASAVERAGQDDCARTFIRSFGRRAFRRPLDDGEAQALYDGVYTALRRPDVADYDFRAAIGALVTAMLQSPAFLYRWELGPRAPMREGTRVRLGPYEVASRLSYLFWSSMPDDQLFAAAEAGGLVQAEDIARQARRLLAHERAAAMVEDFHVQWLGIADLATLTKDGSTFTVPLARSMLAETKAFAHAVLLSPGATGQLATLLGSPTSFVDARLAALYGVDVPPGGTLGPVALDPSQRGGLLTHASFLAAHATSAAGSPSQRGAWVRQRLLCQEIVHHAPPAPALPAGPTTREAYAALGRNDCAKDCHPAIDSVGFAFERYDAVGAYRGDQGIDSRGQIHLDGQDRSFTDAMALAQLLAQAQDVRDCVARQWLRYTLRRKEVPADDASLATVQKRFAEASYDVRELLVALTTTPAFLFRQPEDEEATP